MTSYRGPQDALPVYVDGCSDPAMPGRVTCHADSDPGSGATVTRTTLQTDLLDAIGDQR